MARAVDTAGRFGCPQLNCLAGLAPPGVDPARLRATLVETLAFAAGKLGQAGLRLLVEPCNTRDVPGFYLDGTAQALDLIDDVGADNLMLLYDGYHMQVIEGGLAEAIERHLPRIGHIQIADEPGRHEPCSGGIDYAALFRHLDRLGYPGWVGCEYRPAGRTEAGLGWIAALTA